MRDSRVWAALLRMACGGVWLFEAYPQVTHSSTYLGTGFTSAVQAMAGGNPWRFYRQFLETVVLSHAAVFSYLTLVGNVLIGLCLLFGLLTRYSAIIAILLNLNYGLADGWTSAQTYPLNGLLIVCELAIIALAAGRIAGVDAIFEASPTKRRVRRY